MEIRWAKLAARDLERIHQYIYRVRLDAVEIIRVYHSAQNWP
jgi:plasmid stabilization system protein ParE